MMAKCPNVHDVLMSIMWSHLSHVVTLITYSYNCHMYSHFSHVVTLVTCGHTCLMWSHWVHVATLVTCGHNCHLWSHLWHVVTLVRCHMRQVWPHVVTLLTICLTYQEGHPSRSYQLNDTDRHGHRTFTLLDLTVPKIAAGKNEKDTWSQPCNLWFCYFHGVGFWPLLHM